MADIHSCDICHGAWNKHEDVSIQSCPACGQDVCDGCLTENTFKQYKIGKKEKYTQQEQFGYDMIFRQIDKIVKQHFPKEILAIILSYCNCNCNYNIKKRKIHKIQCDDDDDECVCVECVNEVNAQISSESELLRYALELLQTTNKELSKRLYVHEAIRMVWKVDPEPIVIPDDALTLYGKYKKLNATSHLSKKPRHK